MNELANLKKRESLFYYSILIKTPQIVLLPNYNLRPQWVDGA